VASAETWWLYVLECRGGVLYIGVMGKAALGTKGEALRAEFALKKMNRAQKVRWCARGLDAFVDSNRA
jgi:predicted GIY-YIG superfamily endonuclease